MHVIEDLTMPKLIPYSRFSGKRQEDGKAGPAHGGRACGCQGRERRGAVPPFVPVAGRHFQA